MVKQLDLYSEPPKKVEKRKEAIVEEEVPIEDSIFARVTRDRPVMHKTETKQEETVSFEDSIFSKSSVKSTETMRIEVRKEETVSLEDSIFSQPSVKSTEPMKIKVRKEETIALEDSVFAEPSVDAPKLTRIEVRKEETVPIQDSIFAVAGKESMLSFSVVTNKDKEKDIEEIFNKHKKNYIFSTQVFIGRKCILEPAVFNRCCNLLKDSLAFNMSDAIIDKLIDMIKSTGVSNPVDLLYIYYNSQSSMISFIMELEPLTDTYLIYRKIDKAYAKVFVELGGTWLK